MFILWRANSHTESSLRNCGGDSSELGVQDPLYPTLPGFPSLPEPHCESVTLTAELQRRIQAMDLKCYRKILHISYNDHVTNEEVRAKIQKAIGPHEDLLTIVKRRKLWWYGHVSRSSSLAKTILQGTVKAGRRQDRRKKRWEDNIREWTGLEFAKCKGEKWRKQTGCKIICGAPTTLAFKGLMMIMMTTW